MFHVVHEVDAYPCGRAGVEETKDTRLAGGGNDFDVGESGIASELRHVLGALGKIAVFSGDGWQSDPLLEAFHVFVVELGDLAEDGLEIGIVCSSEGGDWQRVDCNSRKRATDEIATIESVIVRRGHWVSSRMGGCTGPDGRGVTGEPARKNGLRYR